MTARRLLWRGLRRAARGAGIDVVRRHDYSSPIPDLREMRADLWDRPSPMTGVAFDLEAQFALLEGTLAPQLAEAATELRAGGALAALLEDNRTYRSVDLEVLYARVRQGRPGRVVEIGSGVSSLVIHAALERNRADGAASEHQVFDPFQWHQGLAARGVTVTPRSVVDVPLSVFSGLAPGDVLFVDTTHLVRAGGDVNYLLLEALPSLAPGVAVHLHDIYLPWEYPRAFYSELDYYWSEQYLLQAFLAFNPAFATEGAHHALARSDPARLAACVPSFSPGENPTAYWLRRVAA